MMAPPWLDLLDDTIRACATHGRPDLVRRLRDRRAHLLEDKLRILVIGEAGQGKSQLVNALVNAPVCAVGDGVTTLVPAVVEHAESPTAAMVVDLSRDGRRAIESGSATETRPAPVEEVSVRANREAARGDIVRVRIGLPRPLLAAGVVLVDTPAAGETQTAYPLAEILRADAVLMTSDATGELSASELDLLGQVIQVCPTVMIALTKIDLVPAWREVADRNRARLARAGLTATLVPVSATLRLAAAKAGDHELNSESGFGELVERMRRDWLERAELLSRRSAAAVAGMTLEQLAAPLHEEYAATQQADTGDAVARWHAAGRKLEELQRESARWQTLLSDEVADLLSDLEFDLRDRTRRILREVDEFFDAADPSRTWPQFEEWLRENLTTVAETNFGWLIERFDWVARKIARQVAPDQPELIRNALLAQTPAEPVESLRMPSVERFGVGQKLFVGMRGSYSGLLMFGLATTLAGFPLINPISLGAGAAFGAKSVFEERGARLKRRQAQAKTAAQRHVDDFFLAYGKESKDAARLMHRTLRDRFSGFAQERHREIAESAKAIKQVIDEDTARRTRRAYEIKAGMDELSLLRQRVRALGTVRGELSAPRGLTA
ncbi:dynamin family protein [Amycolatopsis anabasis]|uniref:dynamin family protein n=1 Tax=Amycolatopsis anabasis TaxID=1840409 RepID=UPI00131DD6CC|nr:dynamin family protein [Amycolatopsis anabasis]